MILDATCGTRGIWYDKENEDTIYLDRRQIRTFTTHNRKVNVEPNIVADNRKLPFRDELFDMVVYDPPHMFNKSKLGRMYQLYSSLDREAWAANIYRAMREFLRVLKYKGFMVLKWAETNIELYRVLNLIPDELKKLFGTRSNAKTHWIVFRKVN